MQCATHPTTIAIGLCVACKTTVCRSCSTRLQGRNFCVLCLKKRAETDHLENDVVAGAGLKALVVFSVMMSTAVMLASLAGLGFALYMMG